MCHNIHSINVVNIQSCTWSTLPYLDQKAWWLSPNQNGGELVEKYCALFVQCELGFEESTYPIAANVFTVKPSQA